MRLRINLLPPDRKAFAKSEQRFRFVLGQCLRLIALAVVVYGVFFGIHAALSLQVANLRSAETAPGTAELVRRLSSYQEELHSADARAAQVVNMERRHIYWSALFDKLESIAGEGIVFSVIGNRDSRVSLAGIAANRDDLMALRDRLSADECFSDINLPLSNLFVQEQVDFQLDVVFKETCLKGRNL